TIDYNNSYDNGTQFNATLQSENTTKNDEWICGITLNDGTNTSQEGNSTALTIINTQPTIQTTIITPTTPQTNDTLYGYCNATDIDGDQIKYNYTWYKDDVVEFSSIGIKINSISAGSRHTCAIRTNDSRILCWGNNAYGQLGNGTSGGQTSNPQLINDTTQYKQISAGNDFTCGLTINNTVKCWGYNNGGQIGDGTTTQRNNPTLINDTAKYKYLDVGYEATCGILTNGTAKCWGNNYYGELGVGDTTNRTNPTAINDSATYKQISAGYDYTCGILTNGTAKCWGYNTNGELGLGHTTHQYNPITINDTTTYKQIDANYYNTCGILTNGTAKCWGSNSVGQVGDGTTTQKNNPTTINDTTTYLQIMGGADHTCGITNKGQVKCWGDDSSEQLGNGVQTENPNPTNTTDTSTYITITSGEYFSCGILRNGTTKCWGDGSSGQLGDGALSTNQDPTQINNANSFGTGYFDSGEQTLVSIINSEETTGNENWTLSCTPYDSQNYGAQTNTSIIIPATNTAPTITYVESISSQDPQESQNKSISITYTVTDTDGNETINVSSASTIFSKGAIERTNTSCISTNINSTSINITCTIQMTYYDEPGTWNINVSIQDNSAAYVENTTTTMTYNELSAISLNVNEITFGTANIGQENVSGTTLIVNNTGNVNFTQIQIKGYDLTNETNTISAGNITVNVTDSSIGQQIINNTLINITNAQLIKQTIEQIYFYIDVPNIVLPAKQYNSMQPWTIIAEK
ncbi:hypothetical protein K9L67_01510, partial [Candidatus Woesearchaeota archaeon]|nr:hypothetical protein [Candidatus Woesearchaeota archaeon]MCF8013895.1 hypothetical protein [Candidatus Woesearchaeota archaeon]